MPKSNNERQRAFYRRMTEKGFKRVSVWVPAKLVQKINEYAAKLRRDE